MKKLITAFILSASAALAAGTLSAGYRQKDITFGNVSSAQGAYYATADLTLGSFHFAGSTQNNLSLKDSSMYQTDLLAGYKFTSTLVDLEGGAKYVIKGKPALKDFTNHWRPYVTLSKGWLSLTGNADLEAKTTNVEGRIARGFKVGKLTHTFGAYAGYTDVNDALPKTLKEIKYTNAYFGGSYDVTFKIVTAGIYTLRDDIKNDWNFGWRAGTTVKF